MNKLKILLIMVVPIVMSTTSACNNMPNKDVVYYKQKWQNSKLDDYRFIVQRKCFCYVDYTREMMVLVNDGKVVSAQYTDTDEVVGEDVLNDVYTISEWFEVIDEAQSRQADQLQVDFNEEIGNPSKIMIDLRKNRSDDEQAVVIKVLE